MTDWPAVSGCWLRTKLIENVDNVVTIQTATFHNGGTMPGYTNLRDTFDQDWLSEAVPIRARFVQSTGGRTARSGWLRSASTPPRPRRR